MPRPLILTLIFLISCATSEYLSIDTRPRGANVLKWEENTYKTKGSTPIFVKVQRAEKPKFRFSYEDRKSNMVFPEKTYEKNYLCQKRWKDPFYFPKNIEKKDSSVFSILDTFSNECIPYIRAQLPKMKKIK